MIVEKPFGRDSESFRQLSADLYEHLTEDQMFRIDHYLGKELIENLTVRKCKGAQAPSLGCLCSARHAKQMCLICSHCCLLGLPQNALVVLSSLHILGLPAGCSVPAFHRGKGQQCNL